MTDVAKDLTCESVEEGDLVSRYVTDQLSEGDAEAFERHYLDCDRCSAELQAALEIRAALSERKPAQQGASGSGARARVIRGPWSSWGWLAAAAAIGAIAVGGVLFLTGRVPRDSERGLLRALGEELPVEVRLTGQLSSLRPPAAVRSAEAAAVRSAEPAAVRSAEPVPNASGRLRAAAGQAIAAAEEEPSPRLLHSAGVAHLLLGEWDLAIRSLEQASDAAKDARYLSDLAAAYWVRGNRNRNPADFRSSLEKAEQAIARNPRLAEAWFNKAMALERIVPAAPARVREAWTSYLSLDPKGPWADLAREHQRESGTLQPTPNSERWRREKGSLENAAATCSPQSLDPIVRRFPQQTRAYLEDELLPRWGEALDRRPVQESQELLRSASCIGSALSRVTGNALLSEATFAIESATRSELGRERVRDLAAGHRAYGEGQRAYSSRSMDQASILFQRAEQLLGRGRSPFAAAASLAKAGAHFHRNDYEGALEILNTIRREEEPSTRHPYLAARSLWLRGLMDLLRGHPANALASFQAAVEGFQSLGEAENTASVEALLAQTFEYLGEQRLSWVHRDRALRILNDYSDSRILARVAGEAAISAMNDGQARAALFYLDHEIEYARRAGNEPLASDALHSRGLVYLALGDKSPAVRDLRDARRFAEAIADPSIRDRALAELGVTQARLSVEVFGASASQNLSEALAFFRKAGNHYEIARALRERAQIHRQAGRVSMARKDLSDAIDELEATRELLPREDLRISYFANGQVVFEDLMSILSAEGHAGEALAVAEQARARELLQSLAPPAIGPQPEGAIPRPLGALEIADRIPDGLAIAEYAVLEDRLLIWVVRRRSVTLRTVEIRASDLAEHVETLCRHSDPSSRGSGDPQNENRLYDALIAPIAALLERCDTLVVIPDKCLNSVPFARLRDRRSGRYLLERYKLAVSPSATMFLRGLARDGELANGAPPAVLVVGNANLDREGMSPLRGLPGADEEARRVAALFASSRALLGREATKANFIELAPSSDVIHFAGHSILNVSQPRYSSLVFASGSDADLLYAHELGQMRFHRSRLIFLAACETAAGARAGGEGPLSLARAFLASGLPAAIGTLWPVGDAATSQLASRFYTHLLSGKDTITSLQAAQLELLRGTDPSLRRPQVWAAFELIGATTFHVTTKGEPRG